MVRHGFGYFFEAHKLTDLIPGRRIADVDAMTPSARGQHLREVLEELGPTFVKFGQLLSTRPDIVPPDLIAELLRRGWSEAEVRKVAGLNALRVLRAAERVAGGVPGVR